MKKSKIFILVIMLLSIVATGISFAFLSDTIPTHIGIDGRPDQYGSKYFLLIFDAIILIIGTIMIIVSKYSKSENYKKYLSIVGAFIEGVFFILLVTFIVYALSYKDNETPFDVSKIIMIVFGLLFILMGNIMPKIKRNKTLGFKCKWSLYNDVTWQKTHRFVGYLGVMIGILSLLSGLFFKEMINFIILIILVATLMISTLIASHKYYKEEKSKEI